VMTVTEWCFFLSFSDADILVTDGLLRGLASNQSPATSLNVWT
jgi:hypothetical protein